jgi:hypothetical protein
MAAFFVIKSAKMQLYYSFAPVLFASLSRDYLQAVKILSFVQP